MGISLFAAEREGLIRCAHPLGKSMLTFHPTRGDLTLRKQKKLPRFPKAFLPAEREGLIRYAHPFGVDLKVNPSSLRCWSNPLIEFSSLPERKAKTPT